MCPLFPFDNAAHLPLPDAVLFSEPLLCYPTSGIFRSNCGHHFIGKFCPSVALAASLLIIANCIQTVRLVRIPSKIRKAIILAVIVCVTALHTVRAWTNKSNQHESMNEKRAITNYDVPYPIRANTGL